MKAVLSGRIILFSLVSSIVICNSCAGQLPLVSGHRGARTLAPENTLAAADSCIRHGVHSMECDLAVSRDGVFYILHDRTLDRTTDGHGRIAEWDAAAIDTLDAGSWFGSTFAGERVPRFEELLKMAKGRLELSIDYRAGDMRQMMALIEKHGMTDAVYFTFPDETLAREFRAIAPGVKKLQGEVRTEDDIARIRRDFQADIAVVSIDALTRRLVRQCHRNGLEVLALILGMGDKSAENRKAIRLGADHVATDHPCEFMREFSRRD